MNPLIAELFAGDPSWELPSVGVELELLSLTSAGLTTPALATISDTNAALADLPHVGYEPGGQLELHPPPAPTATEAVDQIRRLHDEARSRLRRHGLELLAIGLDPWNDGRDVPLQLDSHRYRAMDAYYASIGPEGRSFMRQTASTQVCVGLRPGADGHQQWRAANLIAPLLAAAFANAPARCGRPLGHNGARTAITAHADPQRHRLDWIGHHPCNAYANYARAARPISPAHAGPSAVAAHLTTLFPPVRPRGTYLEVRSLDALAGDDLATAVVLTTSILSSRAAVTAVLTRLPSTTTADRRRWAKAASSGIRDPAIGHEVLVLIDIASHTARTHLPEGYLPPNGTDLLARMHARISRRLAPGDRTICLTDISGTGPRAPERATSDRPPRAHRALTAI